MKIQLPKLTFLLLLLLISCSSFAQKSEQLREQSYQLLEIGKFREALTVLNKINDKETLETTTVNLYKNHINAIINKKFFKKTLIQDSLYNVSIKTKYLKSHGIYDAQQNKYTIPPIYDSIIPNIHEKDLYYNVFKNEQQSFIDKNGTVLIPMSNYGSIYFTNNNLILANKQTKSNYSIENPITIFNIKGEILYENLNFNNNYAGISNFSINRLHNGKLQVIDIENKKIILDSLDYYQDKTYAFHDNEIASIDIEAKLQQFTLIKYKKKNIVCHNINNQIVQTKEFDTYIDNFYDDYFQENKLSNLINFKKNSSLNENQYHDYDKYIIVKKGNKFGIYNLLRNNFYKQPIYDSITNLGNTFYNNKWINLVYEKEIEKPYLELDGGIVFKENNKFGLLNIHGKVLLNAAFDEIKKANSDWIFLIRKDKKWGFTSAKEDTVLVKPKYDYIIPKYKYLDAYSNKKITKLNYLGKKITPKKEKKVNDDKVYHYFEEEISINKTSTINRIKFEKNKLFGLADLDKKEIVPAIYSNINLSNNNNFIVKEKDSLTGLIDENGKSLIPVKHKNIYGNYFGNDYLLVENFEGNQAIFNNSGENQYPFIIERISDVRFINKNLIYLICNEEKDTKPVTFSINGTVQKMYSQSFLKIENNKVTKIEGYSFSFLQNNFATIRNQKGFISSIYNLENGKSLNSEFKGLLEDKKNKSFFAIKDKHYDTQIDSLLNIKPLKHYFDEIKNDYYYFKEDNLTKIMNQDFEIATFSYPVLKPLVEFSNYSYYQPDFKRNASLFFKFNSKLNNQQLGVIDFNGNIIANTSVYDEIYFLNVDDSNFNSSKNIKEKYRNNLFIGTKQKDKNVQITLFTKDKNEIISFNKNQNESWNFGFYNNIILLKSQDSIKIIDIKTQKKILKIKAGNFQEREDGSYLNSIYLENNQQNLKIYDCFGKIIQEKTFDRTKGISSIDYENYVVQKDRKFGTINAKSEIGIPLQYDSLTSIENKNFIAKKNNKYGIIDSSNLVLIDFKYDKIDTMPEIRSGCNMTTTNLKVVKTIQNNKVGLLNSDNFKTLLQPNFDKIEVNQCGFETRKDTILSIFTFEGKLILAAALDSIKASPYGGYKLFKKGKEVYISKTGELVSENPNLQLQDGIEEKIKYCILKDGKYYLSKNNKIICENPISKIYSIDIEDTIISKYIDFFSIEDENGKFGFYDENFNQILPFDYDEIILTKTFDYLIVKKNKNYGVVNFKNEIQIPFEYESINYNAYDQLFDCKNEETFYKISPNNAVLFKGNQEEFNKTLRPKAIIIPD